jgi:sucrose-6-phosphate hydrolase SacC (GH32 family)
MNHHSTRREFLKMTGLAAALAHSIRQLRAGENGQSSSPPSLYDEEYRPQFHFTAGTGFLADPEMTVYHAGEYHLGFRWKSSRMRVGFP